MSSNPQRNFANSKHLKIKRRRNKVVRRLLPIETLESRMMLSAISLIDRQPAQQNAVAGSHFDSSGYEYHSLPVPVDGWEAASADGGGAAAATVPLSETFQLHSNPGARHTIFLDFDGLTTSGQIWNSAFSGGADIVTAAYSFTGDATFADSELSRIQAIWQRVSEDFIPFDVDVTTEEPSSDALIKSGSSDTKWGVRVAVGGNGSWYGGGAGGVGYVGSFNWSSDTPVFVFEDNLGNGSEKYTAEAISHEAGHALGLNHDGRTSPTEEYYQGQGSGVTGWAPVMGNGYYRELTQWSRGEYTAASNLEDDLSKITGGNGFTYRTDDHGDDFSTATILSPALGTVYASGIIERNDDFDVFTLLSDAGTISLDVTPFERGPNLDIAAALFDATGVLIVASNPISSLSATLAATLAAGQYYVQVTGVGQGDPLAAGYSDYGSLGSYSISGSVVQTDASYMSIAAQNADQFEGDSGSTNYSFSVTRSGDVSAAADVHWNVSGNGASPADGTDFMGGVLPAGLLHFAAGEDSTMISIAVAGDLNSEGDDSFAVVLSGATSGTLVTSATATGTIRNDDANPIPPGITVTPTSGLTTSESGDSASFSVVLDSAPQFDVVISVASSDTSEGVVNKTSLRFTPSNWNSPQFVTVTGVDDNLRDRNVSYVVQLGAAQSSDTGYAGLDAADVQLTNQDNDNGGGNGKKNRAPKVGRGDTLEPVVANVMSHMKGSPETQSRSRNEIAVDSISQAFAHRDAILMSFVNDNRHGKSRGRDHARSFVGDEGDGRTKAIDRSSDFNADAIDAMFSRTARV